MGGSVHAQTRRKGRYARVELPWIPAQAAVAPFSHLPALCASVFDIPFT